MGKVIKIAKHACICPVCKGNGFTKENKEIIQCEQCDSSGELTIQEPTLEFLESFGSSRLQWLKTL